MALENTGCLSFGGSDAPRSINCELGRSGTACLCLDDSDARGLAGVPSGEIGVCDFRGKSNTVPDQAGGTANGYVSSGTCLQKFPFASDNPSSYVATYDTPRGGAGNSSGTDGYIVGGANPVFAPVTLSVGKFPFASDTPTTCVAEMVTSVGNGRVSSTENAYNFRQFPGSSPAPLLTDSALQKFPFASETLTCLVAELCNSPAPAGNFCGGQGHSSPTTGYSSAANPVCSVLSKFPFASDTCLSCVGNTPGFIFGPIHASANNTTCGFTMGATSATRNIGRFPFASELPFACVGSLITTRCAQGGTMSSVSGYSLGGYCTPPNSDNPDRECDQIEKFPFASVSPTTNVGELVTCLRCAKTQQV